MVNVSFSLKVTYLYHTYCNSLNIHAKIYYNHIDFDIGISWKENNPTIDDEKTMVKKLTEYLI